MRNPSSLPPIPVMDSCPLECLLEYAETLLDPRLVRARWTIALEVYRAGERKPADMRWFVLVSLRANCGQLFTMLNRALKRELVVPESCDQLERGTLKELFEGMTRSDGAVWYFPPARRRGAVLFVRKPGKDPNLRRILHYNRPTKRPWIKLTKMTVLRRDGDGSGSPPVTRAALHFDVTDEKAIRRRIQRGARNRDRASGSK